MRHEQFTVNQLTVNTINGLPAPSIGSAGMGKAFYLVPANAATSLYRNYLIANGLDPSAMYTTLAEAEDAMSAYRGDVLYVFPGDYPVTAEINWDKDYTSIVGLNPNIEGDYGQGGCNIYTTTASVAKTLHISGKRCFFQNLKITNAGDNVANLAAVFLEGEGAVFKNVAIQGIMAATQLTEVHANSLTIARGAYFPYFEDCVIGHNTWGPRGVGPIVNAHLQFSNAGGGSYCPDNGTFRRCKFLSWAEVVTSVMVWIPLNSIDRIWLFDECVFYNYFSGAATKCNQVFLDEDTFYTHQIVLKDCVAAGYDEWSDSDIGFGNIQSAMPIAGLGGGLTRPPTAVVGN